MKCSNCTADIPGSARFCPGCGKPASGNDEPMLRSDVTIDWLAEILREQGYETAPRENFSLSLVARHSTQPVMFVGLKPDMSLISLEIGWSLTKPAWGRKTEFRDALNKANGQHWLCSFITSDSLDSIAASYGLWMCERLSKRDVVGCIEGFVEGAILAIDRSGLSKFS